MFLHLSRELIYFSSDTSYGLTCLHHALIHNHWLSLLLHGGRGRLLKKKQLCSILDTCCVQELTVTLLLATEEKPLPLRFHASSLNKDPLQFTFIKVTECLLGYCHSAP